MCKETANMMLSWQNLDFFTIFYFLFRCVITILKLLVLIEKGRVCDIHSDKRQPLIEKILTLDRDVHNLTEYIVYTCMSLLEPIPSPYCSP